MIAFFKSALNFHILIFSCPNPDILSEFKYNRIQGTAEAKLYSMFKFPESNRVHFQCDIVVCKGERVKPGTM